MSRRRCLVPGAEERRSEPAGFTLIELLVALVLAAIVGGSLVILLTGQDAFYSRHRETVFSRQSVQGAAELLDAELRSAGPSDLLAATPESVSIRYDVWWAVMCTRDPIADRGAVFVFDSVRGANLKGGFGYAAIRPGERDWVYDDDWNPAAVEIDASARTSCTDRGAPDDSESRRFRWYYGWNTSAMSPLLKRGSVLRRYGRLTYRFDSATFGSGTALRRNGQELVASFREDASFSYVTARGETVASPATPGDVRAIRVIAAAMGEEDPRAGVVGELDVTVWLRNER